MNKPKSVVTYNYKSEYISANAIKHIFNLLSIYTGINFIEDNISPQVINFIDGDLSEQIKVIISADEIINEVGDKVILNIDPIDEIFKKIALRGQLGIGSGDKLKSTGNDGYYLSEIIHSFVDSLTDANLIEKRVNKIRIWPDDKRFACAVTHDVDMIHRSFLGSLKLCFKNDPPGKFRGFIDSVKGAINRSGNPYNNFNNWINIEKDLGIKSTYFVFAGDRMHKYDPKYNPTDVSGPLFDLEEIGHEIALHSGINCRSDDNISRSKSDLKDVLESNISGIRPHYLSALLPDFWYKAEAGDFSYTSCLGYDDQIGYFSKIDLPFVPFDIELDKPVNIVEIPITLMDGGLFSGKYLEPHESAKELIGHISHNGGLLVLDWHQRVLYDPDYPGWGNAFNIIINIIKENGACFLRMDEIAKLFNPIIEGDK
jgi:peptidoglycan/xylan/chitin deacetylase (PgdA/CDA1 family)